MKKRSFAIGLIIGAMVTHSLSVLATTNFPKIVDTVLVDDVSIIVDGVPIELELDNHILNFKGFTYTPIRSVIEAMGGRVTWVEGRNAVVIDSPPTRVVELDCDREHLDDYNINLDDLVSNDEDDEFAQIIYGYNKIPVRAEMADTRVEIEGIKRSGNYVGIKMKIENDRQKYIRFDHESARIISDGYTYYTEPEMNIFSWNSYIHPDTDEEFKYLYFKNLPINENQFTIIIPLTYDTYNDATYDYNKKLMEYELNVDFSEF